MRKAGGYKDYAISARGSFNDNSFTTYEPPSTLFNAKSMAKYEEIRAEQAKVMMAGAKKGSKIY